MTTTTTDTGFSKVVRLGVVAAALGRYSVFAKIEYDGEKRCLSISGVEGPTKGGNARGGCGQIVMSRPTIDVLAPGWTSQDLETFWRLWDRWHLNDVRAGCAHQRVSWTPEETVEVVTYKLTTEAWQEQDRMKAAVLQSVRRTGATTVPESWRQLLILPWETKTAPDADSFASGKYEVSKRETKALGWLTPEEHPRGMLCRPCEICGYKYGTKWLHEDVPADVLDWFRALPDADLTPAWV